jgi:hypothetical protein
MAGDFSKPVAADAYATSLQLVRDNLSDLITGLEGGDPANLPVSAKRFNPSTKRLQRWNGTVWEDWAVFQLRNTETQLTDWNGAVENGRYWGTSLTNQPSSSTPTWYVDVIRDYGSFGTTANNLVQLAYGYGSDEQWMRRRVAGTWQPWARIGSVELNASLVADVGPILPDSVGSVTVTVQGASVGDFCLATTENALEWSVLDLSIKGVVVSANTVRVIIRNHSAGGTVDPASTTYHVRVLKR